MQAFKTTRKNVLAGEATRGCSIHTDKTQAWDAVQAFTKEPSRKIVKLTGGTKGYVVQYQTNTNRKHSRMFFIA